MPRWAEHLFPQPIHPLTRQTPSRDCFLLLCYWSSRWRHKCDLLAFHFLHYNGNLLDVVVLCSCWQAHHAWDCVHHPAVGQPHHRPRVPQALHRQGGGHQPRRPLHVLGGSHHRHHRAQLEHCQVRVISAPPITFISSCVYTALETNSRPLQNSQFHQIHLFISLYLFYVFVDIDRAEFVHGWRGICIYWVNSMWVHG